MIFTKGTSGTEKSVLIITLGYELGQKTYFRLNTIISTQTK